MRRSTPIRTISAAACAAVVVTLAASAQAAPLPPAQAAEVQRITSSAPYPNATWGISVTDAVTGERVYSQNPQRSSTTASSKT